MFKNQIFFERMINIKLMWLYQDFGNVNSIVCRMINFFKEIMFRFKSVLWFTIGPNFKI